MKKAVMLFNLGGPDKLENVEAFLFNLFNDPAILNLPTILRFPLAKFIANRRKPTAKKIYEELGGSSPILKLTIEQSEKLEKNQAIEEVISISTSSKIYFGKEDSSIIVEDLIPQRNISLNQLKSITNH